jgi:hypothetical protein
MIPKQELFAGSVFDEEFHDMIYEHISEMMSFFPDFKVLRDIHGPDGVEIFLKGTVQIEFGGDRDYKIELDIFLPDLFPDEAPDIWIIERDSMKIKEGSSLRKDGKVLSEQFFDWIPRQSLLKDLIHELGLHFSLVPPFEYSETDVPFTVANRQMHAQTFPSPPPAGNVNQLAVAECNSLLDELNRKLRTVSDRELDLKMTRDFRKIISEMKRDFGETVDKNREEIRRIESEEPPDPQPDPEEQQLLHRRAYVDAYVDTLQELKTQYRKRNIPMDMVLKITRELSREYFKSHLYAFYVP